MERQSIKQPPHSKQPFVVKIYLVTIPMNTNNGSRKIISAKLTWAAAKHIKDQIPGAEIERIFADKSLVEVDGNLDNLINQLKGETSDGTKSDYKK